MSETKASFKGRGNDSRVSVPLLVNCPSEMSVVGLRSEGRSFQTTPSIVGAVGFPVPSIQESDTSQRISNTPTPRLKTGLFGAPTSLSFNVTRNTAQSCVPRV